MKTRTNQEIFDISASHLLKQGQRATSKSKNACVYRHSSGRKCAVGILIPDELYKPAMDKNGVGVNTLMRDYPSLFPYLGGEKSVALVGRLQTIHDSQDPKNWRASLRILAKDLKLKKTVLQV